MPKHALVLPFVLICALPTAHAQPGSAANEALGPARAPTGSSEDAHIGSGVLLPTASVQPAGTFVVGSYELFAAGLSYSPGDKVQLSMTTLMPLAEDMMAIVAPSAKVQILSKGALQLAAIGTYAYVHEGNDTFSAAAAGAALSYCLDPGCHSLASATLGLAHTFTSDEEQPDGFDLGAGGLSWVHRIGPGLKTLLEFGTANVERERVGYVAYGLRATGEHVAVDLSMIMDAEGSAAEIFPLGLPFFAVSYRP